LATEISEKFRKAVANFEARISVGDV